MGSGATLDIKLEDPNLHYDILKKIASGAQGTVLKVRRKSDGLIFAIKRSTQNDGKERQMVINEIALNINMQHPNIISVIEYYEWDNRIYVVLEFMNQGSLFEILKSG